MIERKIQMQKDNIIKYIDENLVSLYLNMGWTKVTIQKEIEKKAKITKEPIKKIFKKD